ncbi:hypothetical protein [Corynebacterium cystitidis]|uniref:hypothetical protein n=1 Tax=Corynebacterium cystitidis TaxID=35757 RepID=UPI00211E4927|nr:hypothetical protein [Corynebacterium cystitidis]
MIVRNIQGKGWAAAATVVALACTVAPAAQAHTSLKWDDETASPGETIVLESRGSHSVAGSDRVRISESTTLPAGWSVWGYGSTFRVAVPATAVDGESVTLEFVTDKGKLIDDAKITVEEEKDAAPREQSASSSHSSPWLTSFLATLGQLLG